MRFSSLLSLSCLLVASAFAQQPTASPSPASSPVASPQARPTEFSNVVKARKLLDHMIAAMGGDKFLNYTSISTEGRTGQFYHGRPTGEVTVFWGFFEYPGKERVELTPQRDVIELYNGDKGWEVTFKGPHEFTADELAPVLAQRPYRLERVMREWLKDPTAALFYEGSDLVEAVPVDKVTIVNARNQSVTLMIDSNTHLLAKKLYTLRDAQGYREEEADVYGNYHFVDGIATAYTVTHLKDGDITRERFLRAVTYNQTFAANFFTPEGAPVKGGKKKK
jgi:hypothetical protein